MPRKKPQQAKRPAKAGRSLSSAQRRKPAKPKAASRKAKPARSARPARPSRPAKPSRTGRPARPARPAKPKTATRTLKRAARTASTAQRRLEARQRQLEARIRALEVERKRARERAAKARAKLAAEKRRLAEEKRRLAVEKRRLAADRKRRKMLDRDIRRVESERRERRKRELARVRAGEPGVVSEPLRSGRNIIGERWRFDIPPLTPRDAIAMADGVLAQLAARELEAERRGAEIYVWVKVFGFVLSDEMERRDDLGSYRIKRLKPRPGEEELEDMIVEEEPVMVDLTGIAGRGNAIRADRIGTLDELYERARATGNLPPVYGVHGIVIDAVEVRR